jgi:prepilin peptidase CpaA
MERSADSVVLIAYGAREMALVLVLIGALYGDLRHGRIPNALTIPAAFLGLILAFGLHGLTSVEGGLFEHLLGLIVPVGIFGIPYMMGWFGAGDVKLLAAIGALKGLSFALTAMLFTGIAGGLLALVCLLARRVRPAPVPANVDELDDGPSGSPTAWTTHLPYGAAIATGTLATWLLAL